jgi:hypothetical protein
MARREFHLWHFAAVIAALGAIAVLLVLAATQLIVQELVERERQTVRFYAQMLHLFADVSISTDPLVFVLLDHIVPTIPFPVVITDPQDEPLFPYAQNTLNVRLDTTWSLERQRRYLRELVAQMRREFPPLRVTDRDGVELARIYYTTSDLVRWIRWLPYLQAVLVVVLLLVAGWAVRLLRRSHEQRLWIAMAKEAAHQLGTPLSAVLAWLEILRQQCSAPQQRETLQELAHDVERLQMVAVRFGQIGTPPVLRVQPLAPLVQEVVAYLQRRVPQQKRIEFVLELDPELAAAVNAELFGWALENLLKNAVEAIEQPPGRILVRLYRAREQAVLEVHDNGRGIPPALRRRIFEPGFTTKRRGWGIGLTLARRIVEEYHNGRLLLRESHPGVGSIFAIELPAATKTPSRAAGGGTGGKEESGTLDLSATEAA